MHFLLRHIPDKEFNDISILNDVTYLWDYSRTLRIKSAAACGCGAAAVRLRLLCKGLKLSPNYY